MHKNTRSFFTTNCASEITIFVGICNEKICSKVLRKSCQKYLNFVFLPKEENKFQQTFHFARFKIQNLVVTSFFKVKNIPLHIFSFFALVLTPS